MLGELQGCVGRSWVGLGRFGSGFGLVFLQRGRSWAGYGRSWAALLGGVNVLGLLFPPPEGPNGFQKPSRPAAFLQFSTIWPQN